MAKSKYRFEPLQNKISGISYRTVCANNKRFLFASDLEVPTIEIIAQYF